MMVVMAPPALPKPKPLPFAGSRPPLSAVLGELPHTSGLGLSSSVLKLDLPANLDAHDLEIIIQVRQSGHAVVEGMLKKSAPGPGVVAKFSVELKRS
jgi:hypothetical protein